MTQHRMCYFVIGISVLFLFSGCAASKNMLTGLFRDSADSSVLDSATHENRSVTSPDVTYQLARHFQKQGRHRLAIEELLKVVRAAPDHANAYNALGVSYDRLREFDLAAASYREALKINPDLAYVHNNIGYSRLLQGNVKKAAAAFETAVSLDREKSQYQNNLTLAYARLGKDQPAPAQPDPDLSQPAPSATVASVSAQDPVKIVKDTITIDELPENDTFTQASADVFYTIQLGVFYDLDKAMSALKKAQNIKLDSPYITKVDRAGPYKPYYRVRAGKYQDRDRAEQRAEGIGTDTPMPAYVTQETGGPADIYAAASAQPRVSNPNRKPVIIKSNADIEILNGNGVRHMARGFQQYLVAQGVGVDRIANAAHFFHPRTIIYYKPGYYGQAKQILDRFHDIDATGKMVKSSAINSGIRIVLGRDVAPVADQLGRLMKKGKPSV